MAEKDIISTLREVSNRNNQQHEHFIQLNLSPQRRQENQYEIQNEGAINRRKIFQREQQIQKENLKKDFRSSSFHDELASLSKISIQQSFQVDAETIQHFDEAQNDLQKQNLDNLIANLEDINIQTDNFTLESQFAHKNVNESVYTHQIFEDDSKQSCNQKPFHTLSNLSRPRKTTIFYDFQQIKSKKYEDNSQVILKQQNKNQLACLSEKISQKIQRINEHFRFYNRFPITYELVSLVSMLLIIAHLFGCGFYYIGDNFQGTYQNQQRQTNWVEANNLKDQDLFTKYLTTLYYCVITMITVGYGDITPISIYEKAYVIGMALISCGVFAYSVNTVGNIFSKLREKNVSYQKEQFELMNYMDCRNIKKQTQMKILKYLEYIKIGKDQNKYQAMEILSQFPQNLREEVQREYFYKILKENSFLEKQFSEKFLIQLSLKMKETTYGPWEKLVSRGQPVDKLYFIIKGQIAYSSDNRENNKFIIDIPHNITMFDFRLFASRKIPHISVSCKSVTQVASIQYSDFVEIIKQHVQDYEKFCFLKDQYLNDRRYDYPCLSCSFYGHSIADCPQLHYKIENTQYFYKKTVPLLQIRQNYQRQEKKSMNSLIYKFLISKCLKSFRLYKLSEKYDSYKNIKILDEIEKYEDDKLFFLNFPKIIQNKYQITKSFTSKSQITCSKSEGYELDETSESSYGNTETQANLFPSNLSQEKIIQMPKSQFNNINFQQCDNNYDNQIPTIFNNANNRLQDSIELQNMNLREQVISEMQDKETETVTNTMTCTENNNKINSSTIISNDPYLQIIANQNNQNTIASKSAFQNEANEDKFQCQYSEIKRRKVSRDSSLNLQTLQKSIKHDILESMKQMQELMVSLLNENNKKKRFTKKKFTINIQNQRKNALTASPNLIAQQDEIDEEQLTQFFKNNIALNKDALENDTQNIQNIHLLGKLNFKFDQMKEFQIYYPKNNFGNVIKAYKKVQNQKYVKHKVRKNKANTEFNTPQNQQQDSQQKKQSNFDQNSNIIKI
ncbi:hypothetical protein ABPG74_010947 [Tetrahymena malaccensis]